jgi:lipopolysaccharide transport system ATP-binding protein
MSGTVIWVENLSKRYFIGHQSAQRERYVALRDVIAREARNFVRKTADLVRGRQIIQGDEVEELWALKDVSFQVNQGEVLGIIGRNGAGKSTLLKILSRITEPTEGRVRLRGRVGSLLEVGTGFHPELTGRENILLNGAILGMKKKEIARKFDEIVDFADLEKFLDTPVKRYSSGMYIRLAFAVAAHLEPEILVVDEVLAVGDAEFQKKCLGKMQDVSRGGRTVLFVSHNMAAVRSLCSAAVLLDRGRVSEYGPALVVSDAYLRQATRSVASLETGHIKRPSNIDSRLRITGLSINDDAPLVHGAAARFTIFFESNESFTDVAFAVALCSLEGSRVMTIDSDVPGERVTIAKGTRGQANICIDTVHLAPTTYSIDIGIRSGDAFALDYLPSVMTATVLPGRSTSPVIASGHGGVRYPCSASIVVKSADASLTVAPVL